MLQQIDAEHWATPQEAWLSPGRVDPDQLILRMPAATLPDGQPVSRDTMRDTIANLIGVGVLERDTDGSIRSRSWATEWSSGIGDYQQNGPTEDPEPPNEDPLARRKRLDRNRQRKRRHAKFVTGGSNAAEKPSVTESRDERDSVTSRDVNKKSTVQQSTPAAATASGTVPPAGARSDAVEPEPGRGRPRAARDSTSAAVGGILPQVMRGIRPNTDGGAA